MFLLIAKARSFRKAVNDLDPAGSKLIHFQIVVVVFFNLLKWALGPSGRSSQTKSQNEMSYSQDCPEA